jgi:predicted kinase
MIQVLVGMIASGKSTYAAKKAEEGWVIINDDAIVTALHGGNYGLYNEKLKPLYKAVEDNILHTAIAMGKNIVIDRGLDLSKKSRRRWVAIAKATETQLTAVVFEMFTPEIHATRRIQHDPRGSNYNIWLQVAQTHERSYIAPSYEEGFDEIVPVKWNS